MKTKCNLVFLLLFVFGFSYAQERSISGTVTDTEEGLPLPGVNVIVKGTSRGTSTDFDGNYQIQVNSGEILEFSAIGFRTTEVTVGNQAQINVSLELDVESLEEVVVVGYGTQKKADLTGAISSVSSEEIEKTPAANVMQSLQGKVSGVQVVSAGSPGNQPTVRLRGLNTYNDDNAGPLFVVDGMFYSNIDFLNPKDIKSMNVLKDASSSAIYGVRAAGGVIIIETKSGNIEMKPQIEYDGYTGMQYARDVVKMANAEQFVTMAYESGSEADVQFVENSIARYGRSRINPNLPNVNTDWYKEIIRPASITNHSIGVTGGGATASYAVGVNYFGQEGVLDMKNEYERFNIRSKVDVEVSPSLKIGATTIFSNATKYSPDDAAWFRAYFAVPIMPIYDGQNTDAAPHQLSNAQLLGYRGTQNPFQNLLYNENLLRIRKLLANVYAEYEIMPEKLTFKTLYSHDFSALDERYMRLPYTLGNNFERISSLEKKNNTFSNQIWDNTLTYQDSFGDHDLTVMAGTSFKDESGHNFSAIGQNINNTALLNESSWYLDAADPNSFSEENNLKDTGNRFYSMSYFGRLAYNFDDRYLLYATMRADGSSKYTKNRWGYFPSVGAGWVVTGEEFFADNGVFDFLKLRASWGRLGNDRVPASAGDNEITVINTDIGDVPTTGTTSTNTYSDLEWEFLEESNFGVNMQLLDRRLSIDADYYIRDTKNAIIPVYQPIVNRTVNRNAATIRNQGFESMVSWNQAISENFSYSITANFSTLKNEVVQVNDPRGYIEAGSAEFRQRSTIGEPIRAFYGWETTGVYQNQAQIDADPVSTNHSDLVPGDLIYRDQNGDNIIDDADRVILGSYLPSFTYGGNIGVNYKDFGLSVSVYGQTGNKILNRKRGEIIFTNDTNMDADLAINRWHGEGTSDTYPSSEGLRKGWNQRLSNFWVEDGAFFRIQNIQLSYNLRSELWGGDKAPDIKFTFTADRPFTFFKYNGFSPEVPNGVDRQVYPIPAVYTFGINLKI
ncbi:TonB-dependent receptor [Galbibacter sp. EGI 63066]|uniref:SusC/RagA family TonB-linked outer membrane protein n=1 Tax=Galbibacter sp. EGI 63066 TaxID=2993559 RepID=UPI0022487C53|nr:TonB-dependent receptor [Galbibacter sp. EGI 63066]MCX2679303.1 TonB-dependent receptor [Galbibacter sp. EGI 63066]